MNPNIPHGHSTTNERIYKASTIRRLSAFFLGLGLLACVLLRTSAAAPIISVGESPVVHVGEKFTVPIFVTDAVDLMAFQFDLSFDSSVLTVVGFTDIGTDFDSAATNGGGALTGLTGFLQPDLISGLADSMSGSSAGLSGSGILATIEFEALALGTTALRLSDVFLDLSPIDENLIVNGSVVVAAPTSTTLVALCLATGALVGRQQARKQLRPRRARL